MRAFAVIWVSGLLAIITAKLRASVSFDMLRSISLKGLPVISSKPIRLAMLKAIVMDSPKMLIVFFIFSFVFIVVEKSPADVPRVIEIILSLPRSMRV